MAKGAAPAGEPGEATEKPSGLLGFVIAMLVATVISAVGGGVFGLYGTSNGVPAEKKQEKAKEEPKQPFTDGLNLKSLAPIVTNLAGPRGTWVRLEAAIVVTSEGGKEDGVLAGKISEDIVAYLRTVPMAQIEGANGFQNLREDLNERARVRSNGRVREIVIQSLVVE